MRASWLWPHGLSPEASPACQGKGMAERRSESFSSSSREPDEASRRHSDRALPVNPGFAKRPGWVSVTFNQRTSTKAFTEIKSYPEPNMSTREMALGGSAEAKELLSAACFLCLGASRGSIASSLKTTAASSESAIKGTWGPRSSLGPFWPLSHKEQT